jgi:predicted ribosomally synthesized peptide with nif11-like leader
MSLENVSRFVAMLDEDESLQREFAILTEAAIRTDRCDVVIGMAAQRGCEFTAEELTGLLGSVSVELSDEDLDQVAGGTALGSASLASARARNERYKIKGFFQGWQEKANQVDQQLISVLRIMKDLGRVGVGGSDLGAS